MVVLARVIHSIVLEDALYEASINQVLVDGSAVQVIHSHAIHIILSGDFWYQ